MVIPNGQDFRRGIAAEACPFGQGGAFGNAGVDDVIMAKSLSS